jgi:aminopeptidase N
MKMIQNLIRPVIPVALLLLLHGDVLPQADSKPGRMRRRSLAAEERIPGISSGDLPDFDVLHYRLDLTFPLITSQFEGLATLHIRSNRDSLTRISLDAVGLEFEAVHFRRLSLNPSTAKGKVDLYLPEALAAGDTFTISLRYWAFPDQDGFYFYPPKCAYTMSEPEDARCWFPCRDVPWDKATAELFVTVPAEVRVASIGLLKSVNSSRDGRARTYHWSTSFPAATYLVCVAMSREYTDWSEWFIDAEGDSIEMPYYVFRSDSAKAAADFVHMKDMMAFFSDRFGPYPFEKYGMAEVEPFHVGGMEHQTMTTFNSKWLQGDLSIEHGFSHELSHMWWGDAVTLASWPEIWLNEGFAMYSEALFVEHLYGMEAFRDKTRRMSTAYFTQARKHDFPVFDPPDGELFNWGIIYNKGGFILHMLRAVVGDSAFHAILKTYFRQYCYRNASIHDFRSVCESVSGTDLGWFFTQWIYRQGFPDIRYRWYSEPAYADTWRVVVDAEQVQGDAENFVFPVDLRCCSGERCMDSTVWARNGVEVWTLELPFKPDSVSLDPDGKLLADIHYIPGGNRYSLDTPGSFRLYDNVPNPFNGQTRILYDIPDSKSALRVQVLVYDMLGKQVRSLFEGEQSAGAYWTAWDGKDSGGTAVSSGVYIVSVTAGSFHARQRMTLVR